MRKYIADNLYCVVLESAYTALQRIWTSWANAVIGRTVVVQIFLGSHFRTGLLVSECGLSKPPEPPLSRSGFDRAECFTTSPAGRIRECVAPSAWEKSLGEVTGSLEIVGAFGRMGV